VPPRDPADKEQAKQVAIVNKAVDSLLNSETAPMVHKLGEQAKADWILRVVTSSEAKEEFQLAESGPKVFLLQGQKCAAIAENVLGDESARAAGEGRARKVFGRYPLDDHLVAELQRDLPKIFQWQNLWRIAGGLGGVVSAGTGQDVRLEVLKLKDATDTRGEVFRGSVLQDGDRIGFRIHNNTRVGLSVSLVFTQADFSIDVERPISIEPGATRSVISDFTISTTGENKALPSTGPEGVIMLAVPTSGDESSADFTCLAQEPLGRVSRREGVRGEADFPHTSFGKLLQYAATAHGTTRGVRRGEPTPIIVSQTWITSP
jgi:hypothetical protein